MATQTSGRRSTRRNGQPQARPPLEELATNPPAPQDTAVGDAIDKLTEKLDSVDLQEHQDKTQRQDAAPGKASRDSPKSSKAHSSNKKPPAQRQAQAEPPIVRRSRRGEKAISTHPLVGRYCVELTSSEGRWCGKFALAISTGAQLGVRMTVEAFDEIFAGEEAKAFNEKNSWSNDSDFYDEQLDFVLRLWGLRRGLGQLQLGVVRDFEGAFVNSCVPAGIPWGDDHDGNDVNEAEHVEREECRTVWIHNDNAMLLGRPCNHYSGVVLLPEGP